MKAQREAFQMICSNPKFGRGHNLSFFGLGPWAIIHGTAKLTNTFISQIWTLMTPFERSLFKLSENHNILLILDPRNSLWLLKDNFKSNCFWDELLDLDHQNSSYRAESSTCKTNTLIVLFGINFIIIVETRFLQCDVPPLLPWCRTPHEHWDPLPIWWHHFNRDDAHAQFVL